MELMILSWILWAKDEVYGLRMGMKFMVLGWSLLFQDNVYCLRMEFMA